ncbi:hypothetical protein LGH83_08915 [Lichenihabitans sp. PAMC28606]|uniref:PIN-like domain-containing protein n=1 Tax=Lichenihabitans sp. PAMC28606 TaxID=2880932 RepID=UPI001D0BC673|nr:hypothetical protein [Lichenihabitans sp. PAMC28606]UDL96277.1 hypothetical protein LGH83_08915 [Lichenihabitans sp. PAMC28606]
MKIKFDENISPRIVAAIRAIESDKGVELGSVLEDYGQGQSDPDWMFRFRQDGGVAMVSGDHNILQTPVNLAAYTASGLISIWPPSGYPDLKRFGQAAFLIRWWPVMKLKIQFSKDGDRWRLPLSFTPMQEARKAINDPRIDSKRH